MEILGIKYIGPVMDNSGYAKAARENILALHSIGIPITVQPMSFEKARPDLGVHGKILNELINKKIDYNIVIMHCTPEFYSKFREEGKFNIGFTIWETTKLHPDWKDYINDNVSALFVGCEWNVGIFKDSGIKVPVFNIPHCISLESLEKADVFNVGGLGKDTFMFYDIFQWCYDDKTRVLTKKGFKYFKGLTYLDEIATLNRDTEELEYQKPEKIVSFRRKDKMLHLKSQQFDICVTPDHKMVTKEHAKNFYKVEQDKSWELKPLNTMLITNKYGEKKVSGKYRAKKNCIWKGLEEKFFCLPDEHGKFVVGKTTKINMDDFLEFFGWYLSEGSLEISYNYYRMAITQTKSDVFIKEIWKCIERMGFTPIDHGKDILFNSKKFYFFLLQFGKCYEKFVPIWLKNLSSRQIMIFLTSMFKGDGSFHKNGEWCKYVSTSKKLAEDVQECLLKVGMSGAISVSDPTKKTPGKIDGRTIRGKRLQYTVSVNREMNEPSMYYSNLKEIEYDGFVYCATVPNHAMLVERCGKVIFSGNTERKAPLDLVKAYWSAFQNNEDVALVLKTYRSDYSEPEKNAIRQTLTRLKTVCSADNFPPIYLILDMLSEDEITGLHKRGDCYVSLDRGEGFGLCVGKKTKISIPEGIKCAEDVKIGDEVLSVDGKFHKVRNVSSKYVESGLILSAVLHEDTVVSNDHPFLVGKNITRHKRYTYTPDKIESLLKWEKSKHISVGDYIAIPKPIINESIDSIDILNIINNDNIIIEGETLCLKNGYSPKDTKYSYKNLVKLYGYSKKIFESAVKHIKNNTIPLLDSDTYKAFGILSNINYEIKIPNKVKRYININEDTLSLFGWYLAEGSTNNDTFLEIDLHRKEYNVAVYLSDVFKKEFGVESKSILLEKYENKSRLIVSSNIIASLFSTLFGKGASNKHIPGWLFKKGSNLLPMIQSLFDGDGYNDGSTYALTTTSISLAYQTKLLLNSFGYCPRINRKNKSKLGNYDIYIVSLANNDYLSFINSPNICNERKFFIETDNYFLVKVTKVDEIVYDDYMFDFSVDGGKSFVGNGLLLHNCPFEAGAIGNPIIVTGFGGVTEYAKPDNSYLVDYVEVPCWGMPWSPWYKLEQNWAQASVCHGAKLMKHVFNNREEAKQRGEKLQKFIHEEFTWEKLATKIINSIGVL